MTLPFRLAADAIGIASSAAEVENFILLEVVVEKLTRLRKRKGEVGGGRGGVSKRSWYVISCSVKELPRTPQVRTEANIIQNAVSRDNTHRMYIFNEINSNI